MLRALDEVAPDMVALFDRDGTIGYMSPGVERLTGYRPDEMIGRPFEEFVHRADVRVAVDGFLAVIGSSRTVTHQTRFRRKDGSWATLESFARDYLEDPELRGVLVFSRDVTHHVELQKTLRQSVEEAAELFEKAPCGYYCVDERGVILRINETELRWLQRTPGELVRKVRFADLVAAADQPAYRKQLAHVKAAGTSDIELELVRKDGSTFPALLQSIAVTGPRGRFIEIRTTLHDITERKLVEIALAKLNRALRVLSEARHLIMFARSESELLDEICRILVDSAGYHLASVHFAQKDEGRTMRLVAKAGADGGYLETADISWADNERGQGPTGTAVRTASPQVNRDFLTNPKVAPWRELALRMGFRSSVSLPLQDPSGVFGTLNVYAPEADAFDVEELRLLEQLADDLSFALASLLAQKFAAEHAALKTGRGADVAKDPMAGLSLRERQILKMVVEGLSSKEIALRLRLAPSSVDTYRSRLMLKLEVPDVTALVRFAIRRGVILP